jgi:hypothetical protein
MLAALALRLVLAQADPVQSARRSFQAGDLARAQAFVRPCARAEKRCRARLEALARYAFLVRQRDTFTAAQAAALLELDRALSPERPGALTLPVLERFVHAPLRLARARLEAGQVLDAWALVAAVQQLDPANAEASRFFR